MAKKTNKPRIWLFGNTSVRSPFRLRDGLVLLSHSSLQGDLYGKKQEKDFRDLLGEHGIVKLGADKTYSASRKWRHAMTKLGFLYPRLKGKLSEHQSELGPAGIITKNGRHLIETESVAGWQECFLRSLVALYIPIEEHLPSAEGLFSPLQHVLSLMLELEILTGDNKLNFVEMALIAQLPTYMTSSIVAAKEIVAFRLERNRVNLKKDFDKERRSFLSQHLVIEENTFRDYADMNLRYIKATGLVQSKGHGITLVPEKRILIDKLVREATIPDNKLNQWRTICNGASLPTDKKDNALVVLHDLFARLEKRGHVYDLTARNLETPQNIAQVRHEMEDLLGQLNELEYASRQASMCEEISEFIGLLIKNKKSKTLSTGEPIKIPHGEAPAYFEWIIWRAFLAIDSLVNKPWEARRFKIDQDFLPIGTAPGNGPDIIFEFDDMVLVVEVTLTSSSRQEAAEGEPVRRHVAKYAEDFADIDKQVFGLFLAVNIDTNTANSFRLGEWYMKNDRKIALQIVPMTLTDFKNIWDAAKDDVSTILPKFRELLRDCRMFNNDIAPEWKKKVTELSQKAAIFLKRQ